MRDLTPPFFRVRNSLKQTLVPLCPRCSIVQTVSSVSSFFLAMITHPEVQRKAREEIDRVIGNDRLPLFADQVDLPYVEAIVKEVIRWNPVTPLGGSPIHRSLGYIAPFMFQVRLTCSDRLGLPHIATEDDSYNGYFIPKGSSVIANIW